MNLIKKINHYFLESSEFFFLENLKRRIDFLDRKKNFFHEISFFVNKCINNPENILFFCCGNFF